ARRCEPDTAYSPELTDEFRAPRTGRSMSSPLRRSPRRSHRRAPRALAFLDAARCTAPTGVLRRDVAARRGVALVDRDRRAARLRRDATLRARARRRACAGDGRILHADVLRRLPLHRRAALAAPAPGARGVAAAAGVRVGARMGTLRRRRTARPADGGERPGARGRR